MHFIPLYYKLVCLFICFNYVICESCFVEPFPRTCKTMSIISHSPRENVSTFSGWVHTGFFVWVRHQMHMWLNLSATSMNLQAGYYRPTPMKKCWRMDVTFYKVLVVMFLQEAAVVGQLLVFVRLSQEIRPRWRTAAVQREWPAINRKYILNVQ